MFNVGLISDQFLNLIRHLIPLAIKISDVSLLRTLLLNCALYILDISSIVWCRPWHRFIFIFSLFDVYDLLRPTNSNNFHLVYIQVRTIMVDNIEKILERGDRIELLVDKTSTMQDGAFHFKKQSKRLRRALWMKNAKLL